ncbi:MAG: MAPEG family protein [Polyangiales bacterium]
MDIPLACVALAMLLIYLPRFAVMKAQARDPAGFDNKDPREQQARLDREGKRALGAHNNAFEAFAPFAAAVLGCEVRHTNARLTMIFAIVHVGARLIYPWLYIKGVDKARSGVWMIGFAATIALFGLAVIGYQ